MLRCFIFCLIALVGVAGCQPSNSALNQTAIVGTTQPQGLDVSGTAKVRVKPDLVVISLGVSNSSARPGVAKTLTENAIKKVFAVMKGAGIEEAYMQTTGFSLYLYEAFNKKPAGWKCTTSIDIRVKNVENASKVLEIAIDSGANQVDGVEYTIQDFGAVRAQARDEACKNAKLEAEQYAKNFGVKLGSPIYITEDSPQGWQVVSTSRRDFSGASAGYRKKDSRQSLSSGSIEVELTVNVTYSLLRI